MTNPADFAAAESALVGWLSEQGLSGTDIPSLLQGFGERLNGLGVAISRGHLATATLDPQHLGFSLTWRPEMGIANSEAFPYQTEKSEAFLQSPIYHMLENRLAEVRYRLRPTANSEFPVLDEFRSQGLTDYYGAMFGFGWANDGTADSGFGELGMICTWATAADNGFGDELTCLKRLLPTFALAIKSIMTWQITNNVFSAYLGPDAAKRVLRGEVRRGSAQSIRAAILFADLRGFTRLADTIPHSDLLYLLNRYFECIVAPLERRGGQVLKFMGDGLLATFDLAGSDAARRCETALNAASKALAEVQTVNAQRLADNLPAMELDIALHLGEVLYGNVGAATRLDFTVIGPAVNEASRMEALCGELKVNLLFSQAFRDKLTESADKTVKLGDYRLRGVGDAQALYTVENERC